MKVGFLAERPGMQSLKYVFQGIERALAERHEIIYRPHEYFFASPSRQAELFENFLHECDVVVGRIQEDILQAREHLDRQPPLIAFLLGSMSRDAFNLAHIARYLKSTDVLVGNCTGDIEITRKFFGNAQTRNLPFAFDESTFYPSDETEKQTIKAEMGFRKDDKILLYAGRTTIEKNLHTVLKLFSVLQGLVPDLHLLVAGDFQSDAFTEFGVYPVNITGTVMKLLTELRLNKERVHFLGHKNPTQLRDIYTVADVLVNMTLHHDENFGLGQVEAMACGTPVVGTSWGGLKDTIKHGETGYQVSTVVTDSGVKINWWEAVNRIVYLLEDEATLQRFRERCRVHTMENFSEVRYSENLESILTDCMKRNTNPGEPLSVTDFAEQFWLQCQPESMSPPPFQRGHRTFKLYKELIAPFTGTTEALIPAGDALRPDQLLVLAVPVQIREGVIKVDDPIFPSELIVPEVNRKTCEAVLDILRKEPVIQLERLEHLIHAQARSSLQTTLKWLIDAGVLLRTRKMDADVHPQVIEELMGKPLFSIQSVDFTTDIIVIK